MQAYSLGWDAKTGSFVDLEILVTLRAYGARHLLVVVLEQRHVAAVLLTNVLRDRRGARVVELLIARFAPEWREHNTILGDINKIDRNFNDRTRKNTNGFILRYLCGNVRQTIGLAHWVLQLVINYR